MPSIPINKSFVFNSPMSSCKKIIIYDSEKKTETTYRTHFKFNVQLSRKNKSEIYYGFVKDDCYYLCRKLKPEEPGFQAGNKNAVRLRYKIEAVINKSTLKRLKVMPSPDRYFGDRFKSKRRNRGRHERCYNCPKFSDEERRQIEEAACRKDDPFVEEHFVTEEVESEPCASCTGDAEKSNA